MSLGFRLMLFNCLLLFLPLAALTVLDVFEGGLLASQENTMASQARVLASTLGAALDAGEGSSDWTVWAALSLARLEGRTITRLRVLDGTGKAVADSSRVFDAAEKTPPLTAPVSEDPVPADASSSLAYQIGSLPFRLWRALGPPEAPAEAADDDAARNPAVLAALEGRYGAHTRVSPGQRSVTLYTAVPVSTQGGEIHGVVLASQSTWRTLQALYEIRLTLFQIFLASVAVALALSFVLSLTITRPLRRMRDMAEGFIDQWGRPTGRFQPVKGSDELAGLSRSLARLGDGLVDHVRFIESFASDLTHELRNPLTAIRAAGELLGQGQTGENARLTAIVLDETDRIDRLTTVARNLGRLDVAVARAPRVPIETIEFLTETIRIWALQGLLLALEGPDRPVPEALRTVRADHGFLRQALDKLVENAFDFSPAEVNLKWSVQDGWVLWSVCDRGPGVPRDQREAIFHRFHTSRRDQGHTGLGLSVTQTIVQAFGGTVEAEDRPGGGAVFTISLPRA